MSSRGIIYDLLIFKEGIDDSVDKAKNDPTVADNHKRLGIIAIVIACIALIGAVFLPTVGRYLVDLSTKKNYVVIGNIMLVITAVLLYIIPLYMGLTSVMYAHGQRKINKKPISLWAMIISWVFFILMIPIMILSTFYFYGILF